MPSGVPRVPEPREWILTKRCSRCKEVKPWARFTPRTYWPDGTVRAVTGWCHSCRAPWRATPEWRRRNRAARVAYERGRRKVASELRAGRGPMVSIAPFRAWLVEWLGRECEPVMRVAERAGMDDRPLRSILNGEQERVALSTVDQVLTSVGEHLSTLYPEGESA